MDKKALWKWLILAGLISASLWVAFPLKQKVRFGLDIAGGSSFTVQIDTGAVEKQIRESEEAKDMNEEQIKNKIASTLDGAQARALEVIRNRVDNLGIAEPIIYPERGNRIIVQLPGATEAKSREAEAAIRSTAYLEFRIVHPKNSDLVEKLFEKGLSPEGYLIAPDTEGSRGGAYRRDKTVTDDKMDADFRAKLRLFHAPGGYEFLLEKEKRPTGEELYKPYFVERRAQLTGQYLKDAGVDYRSLGEPVVTLRFDAEGARRFRRVTTDLAPGGPKNPNPNEMRYLAIVLDGTLHSAPYIKEPIQGGRAEISGSFTRVEARFLANILRAGALPAPVEIIEKRRVDPSLGQDSVHSGVRAGFIGCAAIFVLMAIYYMIPGLLADLALLLNVVILPLGMILVAGFLGLFSGEARAGGAVALPVLTLPGIAGIALTIGMAVDANVLIFERMREELRVGKSLTGAIQAGYARAFSAILDSNVTTIITAVLMFVFGSGPIRGYAVTLTGGLLVSLYTAVVVTRMCFNHIGARATTLAPVRMMSLIKPTNFDFISKWKIFAGCSVAIIAGSWVLMIMHARQDPTKVLSVDFTGGSSVTLNYEEKASVEDIRAALAAAGVPDAMIQYQEDLTGGSKSHLQVKVGGKAGGTAVAQVLTGEQFAKDGFKVVQTDDIGPQVGSEMKVKAVKAMIFALIAMIIYIAWRFEFGFALGAVVALFHDVLVTAGLSHMLGIQMSTTVMAALLTIIGYSVNDTIVIFDRIREDLRLVRNKSFVEICNQSINETLGRTLLTNFMTFVSVLALLVFGGGAIRDFSVAMFIGMIAGTYSTMYIATPVVLIWYRYKTPNMGRTVVK